VNKYFEIVTDRFRQPGQEFGLNASPPLCPNCCGFAQHLIQWVIMVLWSRRLMDRAC